jgi:hypothetical protein
MKSNKLFLVVAFTLFVIAACGSMRQSSAPGTEQPSTQLPPSGAPIEALAAEKQLTQVDEILKRSAQASIAYNAPSEMRVEETVTIELLLNPLLSEEKLKEQISEPGAVIANEVEITPLMKARLVPQDKSAFSILARPDEDHAIQVISGTETTKWSWNVTAQKPGSQRLTISLSRLVKYNNAEYWREVGEYEADIVVQVTPLSWLKTSGWQWMAIILLIGVGSVTAIVTITRRGRTLRKRETGPTEGLGRIFISYRRADSADVVGRIYDYLVDAFGQDVIFKDVDSIPFGVDFKEYLDRKTRECRVALVVIGDRWLDATDESGRRRLDDPADFVRAEVESALQNGIPVIPLLVRGAKMPTEATLPPGLRKLVYQNGIPIRPDPDFHHDMERLISGLKKYAV